MYQSDLDGRVALVTGGTSGIGLATARALAEAGAQVVISGRDRERGARALGELKSAGEVHYVQADVADVEQVEAMVRFTTETFGGLDVAVNSAGVGLPPVPFLEADPSQWQQTIAVNLTGMYHCLRAELRAMVADPARARRASIVNISSMAARISFPGIAPYCASKGGVVSLTRAVALEFAPMGIRVNVISPAVVETPMQESLPPPMRDAVVHAHPVGRIGRPEEIARAARWLCSDACGFLTGHDMVIDGGYSLQ